MKIELFPKPNVPNANGIVYTEEAIESMKKQLQEKLNKDSAVIVHSDNFDKNYFELCDIFRLENVMGKITSINDFEVEFVPMKSKEFVFDCITPDFLAIFPVSRAKVENNMVKQIDVLGMIICPKFKLLSHKKYEESGKNNIQNFNNIIDNVKSTSRYIAIDDYGNVFQSINEPWIERDIRDNRIWAGDETFEFICKIEGNKIALFDYSPDHKDSIENHQLAIALPIKKRDKLANILGLYLGSPINTNIGRGVLKCVCIYNDEMQTIVAEIENEEYEISLTELDKYEFKLVLKDKSEFQKSHIKSDGQSLIKNSINDAMNSVDINILSNKYFEKGDFSVNYSWVKDYVFLDIDDLISGDKK